MTDLGGFVSAIVTSYVTTFDTTVEVDETFVTVPAIELLVSADNVTDAGWPGAIFVASASGKLATTSSEPRFWIVMNAVDDDAVDGDAADDELAPPFAEVAPVLPLMPLLLLLLLLVLLPTVSPTAPLTAVMVPLIGARSVVAASVFASVSIVISSCVT